MNRWAERLVNTLRYIAMWTFVGITIVSLAANASEAPPRFLAQAKKVKAQPNDIILGNNLRAICREEKVIEQCIGFFDELVEQYPREVGLRFNAALAYVDNVPGHSILIQARLSTRSIDHVTAVLETQPDNWFALYVRGVNNIYWPSWYKRNDRSISDLERCVKMAEAMAPAERKSYYVLAYIVLGDALIKADKETEAKEVWRKGMVYGAYTEHLTIRLAKNGEELRDFINAVRSREVPVDTDISFLYSPETTSNKMK